MNRINWAMAAGVLTLIPVGCGHLSGSKPPGNASNPVTASLLDSGTKPRVSRKQAADLQFALGRAHEKTDHLDFAETAYKSVLEKDPGRGDAEARLAVIRDLKGDPKGADDHYDRALKLDPGNADLLVDRGYSLYLRGTPADLRAAEGMLRRGLAVDPNHLRGHNNLGLVLARRGDADGALGEFARAGVDPADARANLATVYALDGRAVDAREQYALALASKPGSPTATEGLRVASAAASRASTSPAAPAAKDPGVRVASAGPDDVSTAPGAGIKALPPLPR